MRIEELTEDNLNSYSSYLDPEEAENIGREYYHGVAVTDDMGSFLGAMIWELKNLENDDKDTESRLTFVSLPDREAADCIFDEYAVHINAEDVKQSIFEFPVRSYGDGWDYFREKEFDISEAEGSMVTITVGDLSKLTSMKLNKGVPSYVKSVTHITEREYTRGVMNCIFRSKRDLLDDLSSLNLSWFEPDLSCYVESDGKIEGFFLVHKTSGNRLRVELMVDVGPDSQKALLHMMRFSMKAAIKKYPPQMQVLLRRSDHASRSMISFLFPNAKGEPVIAGHREENQ